VPRADDRSGLATALLNLGASYIELSTLYENRIYVRKAAKALEEAPGSLYLCRQEGPSECATPWCGVCSLYMFRKAVQVLREALQYFETRVKTNKQVELGGTSNSRAAMAQGQQPTMRRVIRPRRPPDGI